MSIDEGAIEKAHTSFEAACGELGRSAEAEGLVNAAQLLDQMSDAFETVCDVLEQAADEFEEVKGTIEELQGRLEELAVQIEQLSQPSGAIEGFIVPEI